MRAAFKIHPGTGGLKGQATRIIRLSVPGRYWANALSTVRRPFNTAFSAAFGGTKVAPFSKGFSLGFGCGTAFNYGFNEEFA